MYTHFTTYLGVTALADGAYLGRVGSVTLPGVKGDEADFALLEYVKSQGWDCNGVACQTQTTFEVMPDLRYRVVGREGRGWPLHNSNLKMLMGLPERLPTDHKEQCLVGNVIVWLNSAQTAKDLNPGVRKPHRLMAECPRCEAHVPAGRLFQHKCK